MAVTSGLKRATPCGKRFRRLTVYIAVPSLVPTGINRLAQITKTRSTIRALVCSLYKIMQGMERVSRLSPSLSASEPRGHPLNSSIGRTNQRDYFFTHYVISLRNILPQEVVRGSGLEASKGGLGRFLEENSITGYKL